MYNIQLLDICEVKVGVDKVEKFRYKLGFDYVMDNAVGSITLLFFNHPFNYSLVGEGSQHLLILVNHS